ncbi:Serine/threonine-protein kinase receptor [Caenorhabditis elegans]|uniref:Serine/threonine-protein kinase receptor n=1 Tax=Caenorhabditis elegans TaxID=6239 RepID=A0A131MB12_CAEEL|nr:Serine/threonine-protein kinase receptor [Caenorhabditis elegans]CZR14508.1 Serine/threonine-protein kinase receptor [Caenorhabditis elegans]|eukprot:NP_001309588.1 Serine/threonine-protein kinase receptor [Caenorhabditis elegans]
MNQKGTVRLKALVLICLPLFLIATPVPVAVTEDDRQDRIESEAAEKEWANTLVSKVAQSNGTGTIKVSAPAKPTLRRMDNEEDEVISIECVYYDEMECEKSGDCEITKKTCYSEAHLKAVGCLAVFGLPTQEINSTEPYLKVDKPQYKSLGCMPYQHADSMNCENESSCRQGRSFRGGIGMCCCSTNNCNMPDLIEMVNPSLKKDKFPFYWIIIIALSVILCIALLILAYVGWKFQQNKKEEIKKQQKIKFDMEKTDALEAGNVPLVEPEEEMIEMVETPKELPITDFQLISKGRFGKVFKAQYTPDSGEKRLVAVKKLNEFQKASFLAEKRIFDELNEYPKWYKSIVEFVCAEKIGDEYWIVTEFHERLSLYELLKNNVISITSANRIIMSMIDGLQFLHDDRPYFFGHPKKPIIHRDIKSKNILVKSDMTTCIADFGLARIYSYDIEQSDLLGQVGTKRYMSPEMLEGATEFTPTAFKAMDVYSMGLVMWEVISRTKLHQTDEPPNYQMPFQVIGFDPTIGLMRNYVVSKKERPQWRDEIIKHEYMSLLKKVTEEMWDPEACARITAGCAFARVWNHIMSSPDSSEGYHSGSSMKNRGVDDVEQSEKPEGIEEMQHYHASSPSKRQHPSPNPFFDSCPPPPPIPVILENGGILQPDNAEPEPEELPDLPIVEKIYDIATNMLFSREELDLMNAQRQVEYEAGADTRASTPTPSGTFGTFTT